MKELYEVQDTSQIWGGKFNKAVVIRANALKTNQQKSNLSYFLPQIYLWHSCCVGFLFPEEKEGQMFGNWGERD